MSALNPLHAGEYLRLSVDTLGLRDELTALCRPYGQLLRLDILPAGGSGRQQVLCVLRMQTLAQDQRLMQALGIGRFGGDLVLVIDLSVPLATQVAPSTPAAYRAH